MAPDTRAAGSPWNIYQTTLDSWEYFGNSTGIAPVGITVNWRVGYSLGTGVSAFLFNKVQLDGTLANGDQWNDAVIAHEIGHWVMHNYAVLPPDYLGLHGDCTTGKLGLEYSEGWANFFMAAARSRAYNFNDRTNSSRYIDAPDDRSDKIGTKPTSSVNDRPLESNSTFDPNISEDFRKGNSCEYQVAGALLDIFDSNSDGKDKIQRSFADIFKAFQTKYNNHYPYNINEWWYGWTNTLGNRSGSSLGNIREILDIFEEHKILVGVRIDLSWSSSGDYLSPLLWLPPQEPYLINCGNGSYTGFPFANTEYLSSFRARTWITSLHQGIYTYMVDDGSEDPPRFAAPSASATIFDGSLYSAATITAPTNGPVGQPRWLAFTFDGTTGNRAFPNIFYSDYEPYPDPNPGSCGA